MIGYAKIDHAKLEEFASRRPKWRDELWSDYFYEKRNEIPANALDPVGSERDRAKLAEAEKRASVEGQRVAAYIADGTCAVVGYGRFRFALPAEAVEIDLLPSHDDESAEALAAVLGSSPSPPSVAGASAASVAARMEEAKKERARLEEEARRIADGTAAELADLKAKMDEAKRELEAKKAALEARLREKEEELGRRKAALERDAAILDAQICAIRLYLGETAEFRYVRRGPKTPAEEPIVAYQKVRYLDEELGKIGALSGGADEWKGAFLDLLANDDRVAEAFAPGPKSVSVAKLSRTGTTKGASPAVANVLEDYSLWHENQMAALIRDGGDLSIAWLDPEKVDLGSEDLFLAPKKATPVEAGDEGKTEPSTKKDVLSRWFLFALIQGAIDRGEATRLPEGTSLAKGPGEYVKFSWADGRLEDGRYGAFAELLAKGAAIRPKKGDAFLTGTRLTKSALYADRAWDNERGIGAANRTRGAYLPGMAIVEVNLAVPELLAEVAIETRKAKIVADPEGRTWWTNESGTARCTERSESTPIFFRKEASYSVETTDETESVRTAAVRILPDAWTAYAKSPKALTEKDLVALACGRVNAGAAPYYVADGAKKTVRDRDLKEAYENGADLKRDVVASAKIVGIGETWTYASVAMKGWSARPPHGETEWRVNFRFYPDEAFPVDFLCPSWVKHAIVTGKIGDLSLCGSRLSYADALPYLRKALEYAEAKKEREREALLAADAAAAEAFMAGHEDWDVAVAEWRIANEKRELTPASAKRFLTWLKKNGGAGPA